MRSFRLSGKLKRTLSKPMGRLVSTNGFRRVSKRENIIAVGDIVALHTQRLGYKPTVFIIDGKTERTTKVRLSLKGDFIELRAKNPPSKITDEAWNTVKEAFCYSSRVKITISGEEDLLGLPVVYFSPLNTVFVYGQRGKGMVVVRSTIQAKKRVEKYLGKKYYDTAVMGGSWDRLHAGHKYLLLTAFEWGKKVFIGITTDRFLREMKKEGRNLSFAKRKNELVKFLRRFGLLSRARIFPIDDFVGRSLEYGDVLIGGDDVYRNALKINSLRRKHGKKALKIVKIDRIPAEDRAPISSTRIRRKEIDRDGRLF